MDEMRKRKYVQEDTAITTLRLVVGGNVSHERLETLLKDAGGDVQRAADRFFSTPDQDPGCWSLCKGPSPIGEGDAVQLARSKPTQSKSTSKRSRWTANTHREDTIVRFTTTDGKEVGRLPKDVAKYVAKLLDLDLCEFDGRVVWCPSMLGVGSDILLQFNCYFSPKAFDSTTRYGNEKGGMPKSSRSTETGAERLQADRTLALMQIVRSVGLKPSRSAMQRMNITSDQDENETRDLVAQSVLAIAQGNVASTPGESHQAYGEEDDEDDGVKQVTNDQLDTIYQKAQVFDASIVPVDEPDTMALTLKPYQKRALAWMLTKETDTIQSENEDLVAMHPLWEEYMFPRDPAGSSNVGAPDRFYFNPYNGDLSLTFPESDSQERGGILADEMGLGKTIEMISLVHANRCQPETIHSRHLHPTLSTPATLIVCPMSLLAQWRDEMYRASKPGTIKVEIYYGDNRNQDITRRLCSWNGSAPDVLLTTYGTVMSEWGRSNSVLFTMDFWRVILDEAHQIKNRLAKTSRACHAIKARRRWALSGTPIQNKLEDVYSLLRFLVHEPWSNYTFWRTFVTIPFERKDPRALQAVQTALEPMVLRRTKNMTDVNGEPIVSLPPKTITIEYLDFSEAERDIYDSLYTDSKTKFSHYCAAGKALSHYASIFHLLMRLRQVACHPYLVLGQNGQGGSTDILTKDGQVVSLEQLVGVFGKASSISEDSGNLSYGESVVQSLLNRQASGVDGHSECPICFETADAMLMMPCMHMGCRPCIEDYLQKRETAGKAGECPLCRHEFDYQQLLEIVTPADTTSEGQGSADDIPPTVNIRRAVGGYRSSTKIDALLRHIQTNVQDGHKTVVFSQFTSFLNLIELAFQQSSISYSRLDGTLSQSARERVLQRFGSTDGSNESHVLLISLRAGGVGLNLTSASRVIIMDPWWNYAVEAQAIDRVHRFGQTHEVRVTRFIVKDTVEERILEIQKRKHMLADQLYLDREELKTRQLQELELLFG